MEHSADGEGPERIDSSLVNFAEIVFPCLDAVAPRRVIEIGAYRGEFTAALLDWAGSAGASITAIEPDPPPELLELLEGSPELELVREPSLEALPRLGPAQAVVIDGDHNYYTVREELRAIERAGADPVPLLILHDVCWPHARRDTYYAPERIPERERQPLARDAFVAPGEPGVASAGLRFDWAAAREGGARNGVLTAVEDFIEGRDELRLAVVPAVFGLGLVWSERADWAEAVARIVEPWDRNPIIARLETDRLAAIVDEVRFERQRELLRSMLHSRAFAMAERLSSLRQGGKGPVFSRAEVSRLLGEQDRSPADP